VGGRILRKALDGAMSRAGLRYTCDRCAGIHRRSVGILLITDRGSLRRCPACGLVLNALGEAVGTLMADGKVSLTVLRFEGPTRVPAWPRLTGEA
jgi:hypothetical protein